MIDRPVELVPDLLPPGRLEDGAWCVRYDGRIAGYLYVFESRDGPLRSVMIEHWFVVVSVPSGNTLHTPLISDGDWRLERMDGHDRGSPADPSPPPACPEPHKPLYVQKNVVSRVVGRPFER